MSFALASSLTIAAGAEVSEKVLGRIYERKMHADDGRYLDLDTGELVQDLPPGDLLRDFKERDTRIRVGKDMIAVPVPAERWNAGVEQVLKAVSKGVSREEVRFDARKADGAWFFRTREGATGVLKLVSGADKPDSLLVRFKRIRGRRQFDPSVTVVLSQGQRELALTDSETESAGGIGDQALAYHGVVRLERHTNEGWRVMIEDIYQYSVTREKGLRLWEVMSAEEISEPTGDVGSSQPTGYGIVGSELPRLILFPQWGMLQIAEADLRDAAQPSVTVRYKRVAQGSKTQLAAERKMELEQQLRRSQDEVKRGIFLRRERLIHENSLPHLKLEVALCAAQLRGQELEVERIRFLQGQEQLRGWADWHRRHQITDAAYEDAVASVRRKYDLGLSDDLK